MFILYYTFYFKMISFDQHYSKPFSLTNIGVQLFVVGIKTLCLNPSSQLVFAGSAVGYTYCWDLR